MRALTRRLYHNIHRTLKHLKKYKVLFNVSSNIIPDFLYGGPAQKYF